jgi:hypothetical protein
MHPSSSYAAEKTMRITMKDVIRPSSSAEEYCASVTRPRPSYRARNHGPGTQRAGGPVRAAQALSLCLLAAAPMALAQPATPPGQEAEQRAWTASRRVELTTALTGSLAAQAMTLQSGSWQFFDVANCMTNPADRAGVRIPTRPTDTRCSRATAA